MSNAVVHDNTISVSVESKTQLVSVVEVKQPTAVIVNTGMRGESGAKPIFTANSLIALSGQRVIAIGSSGEVVYADSSNEEHVNSVIGVTISASSADSLAYIQTGGIISEPTWNWDLDKPIILGLNGFLVQDIPVESKFYLLIGKPLTEKSMVISIQTPFIF